MTAIVFAGPDLRALREQLLEEAPNEAAAVLLAGRMSLPNETRLLVREVHVVPAGQYDAQSGMLAVVSPTFLAPLLKRARNEGWSLVLVHTHPFAQEARFSVVDDEGERVLMPVLMMRAGGRPHGALLLSQSDCRARLWDRSASSSKDCDFVTEVGTEITTIWRDGRAGSSLSKYDRSIRALGALGQEAVAALTVGIVGLGGLGSIVAQQMAHLGAKKFILIDPDSIEETNLNRLVGAGPRDVGRSKVAVARRLIRGVNPEATVTALRGDVLKSKWVKELLQCNFLFCCTDSHGSRAVINQVAYQFLIPTIDLGVRVQTSAGITESITGRVQMLAPELPCLVCQNLLDPEEVRRDLLTDDERERDPYIVGIREPQPAVISLNGTVASLGVTMMLSAVAGLRNPSRHQVVLFDKGTVRTVSSTREPRCVVCSNKGALARGDLWPLPGRAT